MFHCAVITDAFCVTEEEASGPSWTAAGSAGRVSWATAGNTIRIGVREGGTLHPTPRSESALGARGGGGLHCPSLARVDSGGEYGEGGPGARWGGRLQCLSLVVVARYSRCVLVEITDDRLRGGLERV